MHHRLIASAALAAAVVGLRRRRWRADFTYGSWPPAGDYINRVAMPKAFAEIAKQTNGEINWKLVPGGQLADPKACCQAVRTD